MDTDGSLVTKVAELPCRGCQALISCVGKRQGKEDRTRDSPATTAHIDVHRSQASLHDAEGAKRVAGDLHDGASDATLEKVGWEPPNLDLHQVRMGKADHAKRDCDLLLVLRLTADCDIRALPAGGKMGQLARGPR